MVTLARQMRERRASRTPQEQLEHELRAVDQHPYSSAIERASYRVGEYRREDTEFSRAAAEALTQAIGQRMRKQRRKSAELRQQRKEREDAEPDTSLPEGYVADVAEGEIIVESKEGDFAGVLQWELSTGEITWVSVEPHERGKNIARAMLKLAVDLSQNVHHSEVLTREGRKFAEATKDITPLDESHL